MSNISDPWFKCFEAETCLVGGSLWGIVPKKIPQKRPLLFQTEEGTEEWWLKKRPLISDFLAPEEFYAKILQIHNEKLKEQTDKRLEENMTIKWNEEATKKIIFLTEEEIFLLQECKSPRAIGPEAYLHLETALQEANFIVKNDTVLLLALGMVIFNYERENM
eukprot:2351549-Rhodomonas_salina.1